MGVRIFSDAARLTSRPGSGPHGYKTGGVGLLKQAISGNFKMQAIYDGSVGKQGLPQLLDANVAWMDASGLFRMGNQFGPNFQNVGTVACVVEGCNAPRNYANEEITQARIDELEPLWEEIATLAPGASATTEGKIYSLVRFTFTAGGTGGVSMLSA